MKLLLNHGLTAGELYTNVPRKVCVHDHMWYIHNVSWENKFNDVIGSIFSYCLYIVMKTMIEENKRFYLPTNRSAFFDFSEVKPDDFEIAVNRGAYKDIDFIQSQFRSFRMYYNYGSVLCPRKLPVYFSGEFKQLLTDNINRGRVYCATSTFRLDDILPIIRKRYKVFTIKELKRLLTFGFKRMAYSISFGAYISIHHQKYVNFLIHIGYIYNTPNVRISVYKEKKNKKLRLLAMWDELEWDDYFYFCIAETRIRDWVLLNKRTKTLVLFHNIIIKRLKAETLHENSYGHIFRVRIPGLRKYSMWVDELKAKDVKYVGTISKLKLTEVDKTWKELRKEYETTNS